MKIQQISNKTRPRILALVAVVAIISVLAALWFVFAKNDSNDPTSNASTEQSSSEEAIDNSPATDEELDTGDAIKKDALEKNEAKDETTDPQTAPAITIASAIVSDSNLVVRTNIQSVTNSGVCNLSVTNNASGARYVANADVQPLASFSTCKGFDVPLNELSNGTWNITVTYVVDSKTSSATREVTIE